jgi:hypothetical protein
MGMRRPQAGQMILQNMDVLAAEQILATHCWPRLWSRLAGNPQDAKGFGCTRGK